MFWKRSQKESDLAVRYRQMGEVELEELAQQIEDLTEAAQQALRQELESRGMTLPSLEADVAGAALGGHEASIHVENAPRWNSPDAPATPGKAEGPAEYTWKTPLAEFADSRQAWQLAEMLRQAGIDSWIDAPRSRYVDDLRNPKVLVAADQLELARQVAAQPVPDEIVAASMAPAEAQEFELPCCPQCGAEDPLLEEVDPVNCWLCEGCGHTWQDEAAETGDGSGSKECKQS